MADAKQTDICAYLAVIELCGLATARADLYDPVPCTVIAASVVRST